MSVNLCEDWALVVALGDEQREKAGPAGVVICPRLVIEAEQRQLRARRHMLLPKGARRRTPLAKGRAIP
ncbi:hypothetical protein [Xanthomonas fragariae]|uniref:hypothetical protein n=1 Tax=Xanthomonas fragariae TaxID=48664 RepID=UPI001E597408|nr:hypothetical protein [Xanthomonas fragariae]